MRPDVREPSEVALNELISFFSAVPRTALLRLLSLSAISAAATASVLALVNHNISMLSSNTPLRLDTLLIFLAAIGCFGFAHYALINGTTRVVEGRVYDARMRLLERIRGIRLSDLEQANAEQIFVCINTEMRIIADAAFTFATIGEQTLILIFTLTYVSWISPAGLICAIIFIVSATTIHLYRNKEIAREHQRTFELESNLTGKLSDFLRGFKELKLSASRSDELMEISKGIGKSIFHSKTALNKIVAVNHISAEVSYLGFLCAIVFIVPFVSQTSGSRLALSAISALFMIAPTFSLINALPVFQKINAAAKAIASMESRLGKEEFSPATAETLAATFQMISLRRATYRYRDGPNEFRFGPIDLDVQFGKIIFITGGNGSGKSTLLKLLTGLYIPDSGELRVDGQLVTTANVQSYRGLFAAIFSDNYLFKELYGIAEPDPADVAELFRFMELEKKSGLIGKAFANTSLSTGQRKRLAMISLILERRPICVLDEWAADQDVHFRRKFYQVILPWLRSHGKTVIAVTHDEKYFEVADERINLEEGAIVRPLSSLDRS